MTLRRERSWGCKRIAKFLGMAPATVQNWLSGKRHPMGRLNRPTLTPSRELSYLIGVYLGDGTLFYSKTKNRTNYGVKLLATNLNFVKYFDEKACEILNKEKAYPIFEQHKSNLNPNGIYYICSVYSRILYEFFKKRGKNPKRYNSVISQHPFDFIRGFFDSEGWIVNKNRKGHRRRYEFHLCNTKVSILEYIQKLINDELGILSYIISMPRSNIGRKKMFNLNIYKKDDVLTLSGIFKKR